MTRAGRQSGLALVEFALTIGFLVAITFGITEFGRAIYQYDTLAKAARDAARYLSTKAPGDAAAIAEATCLAVYGTPSCTGSPLVAGLTTAMVSVCDAVSCPATNHAQGSAPVQDLVTLTIGGQNNPFTFASAMPGVVPNIPFGAISVTMRQVL
ncbi:MAG TPA: TadE family protein [Rhodocyclaceae bacterium]